MLIDELPPPSIDDALAAAVRTRRAAPRVLVLVGRDLRVLPVTPGAEPVVLRRGQQFVMPRLMEPSAGAGTATATTATTTASRAASDETADAASLPARVACTMPGELRYLQPGRRVHFPRTGIVAVVVDARLHVIRLRVVRGSVDGAELRAGDAIDLPDLPLWAPALTIRDLSTLAASARRADVVVLRRSRCEADIDELRKRLVVLGLPDLEIRVAGEREDDPDEPQTPDSPSSRMRDDGDDRDDAPMSRAALRRSRSASIHVRPAPSPPVRRARIADGTGAGARRRKGGGGRR